MLINQIYIELLFGIFMSVEIGFTMTKIENSLKIKNKIYYIKRERERERIKFTLDSLILLKLTRQILYPIVLNQLNLNTQY
jgi:hypothetical protein